MVMTVGAGGGGGDFSVTVKKLVLLSYAPRSKSEGEDGLLFAINAIELGRIAKENQKLTCIKTYLCRQK